MEQAACFGRVEVSASVRALPVRLSAVEDRTVLSASRLGSTIGPVRRCCSDLRLARTRIASFASPITHHDDVRLVA